MADILTMQDLANGHLDVKALGEAANGDENTIVTTRTGNTYPSAERAISIMFQNGGLPALAGKTFTDITGKGVPEGGYGMVTDDPDPSKNGLYVVSNGAWVKSNYSPLMSTDALGRFFSYDKTSINISTSAKTLITKSNGRIFYGKRSDILPNSNVALPTIDGAYRLEFNTNTKAITISLTSTPLARDVVIFGSLIASSGTYTLHGLDNYSIDGVAFGSDHKSMFGALLATNKSDIVFDFTARKLNIKASTTRLIYNGKTLLLPETEITWTAAADGGWNYLAYNTSNNTFRVYRNTITLYREDVIVAYFNPISNAVSEIPTYSVAGAIEPSDPTTPFNLIEHKIPYGNVYKLYSAPDLPELNTVYESTKGNVSAFYALYDALVSAYPSYIAMTVLGVDKDGNEIRQYRFNAPDIKQGGTQRKPKIILCSNIHPEYAGTYNLYSSLKTICENWQTDDALAAIRWGADLVVVPLAVPYVFINDSRKNGNGVDIARNFEIGWALTNPATNTYGGAAPLDQVEAQILDGVMNTHSDAIAFASHHSFFATSGALMPNGQFCWIPHGTEYGANLGRSLVMSASVEFKKRYAWLAQGDADYIGYADTQAPLGSEGLHATGKYNMQGCTFETTGVLHKEAGKPFLSSAVTTMGAYCLVNWLILNLRHTTDFYNSQK